MKVSICNKAIWRPVALATFSSGRRLPLVCCRSARAKAAVNTPQSRRFAKLRTLENRVSVWSAVAVDFGNKGKAPKHIFYKRLTRA